jgi:uncharacterized alpha-E superfamily protein
MEQVLSLNENLITYRRHYRTTPQLRAVLELILGTEVNPRSLVSHLGQAAEQMYQLPPPADMDVLRPAATVLKRVRSRLMERKNLLGELGDVLEEARNALEQISDSVSLAYFSHTAAHALEEY